LYKQAVANPDGLTPDAAPDDSDCSANLRARCRRKRVAATGSRGENRKPLSNLCVFVAVS